MEEPCFIKKGSDPPVCDVHNVPLEESTVAIDPNAPHLGRITCLRCPVTRAIADWPATQS
jgi:hypothetical protein